MLPSLLYSGEASLHIVYKYRNKEKLVLGEGVCCQSQSLCSFPCVPMKIGNSTRSWPQPRCWLRENLDCPQSIPLSSPAGRELSEALEIFLKHEESVMWIPSFSASSLLPVSLATIITEMFLS